jgi:hypothetical protein
MKCGSIGNRSRRQNVWRAACLRDYLQPIKSRMRSCGSPKINHWPDAFSSGGLKVSRASLDGAIEDRDSVNF